MFGYIDGDGYWHPNPSLETSAWEQWASAKRIDPLVKLHPAMKFVIWGPEEEAMKSIEKDPNGKDAHSPGAKLDDGKNRLGLVLDAFSASLWEVGRVGTYGAQKYTENGWQSVPDAKRRYKNALYRHLFKEAQGEYADEDTGIAHAAHAAWNALAYLHFVLEEHNAKSNQS